MQWCVTVTDNHGQNWLFVLAAKNTREAIESGRSLFRRQAPRGTYATAASVKEDARRAEILNRQSFGA
jgi:hypothetical protein